MKILIIYAAAGAGHKKAAEALFHYLKENTSHEIVFADVLDYTQPLYKKNYEKTYVFCVTKAPWLWGFFFALTDCAFCRPFVRFFRRAANSVNAKLFEEFLVKEQFDAVFSTHFFPNEVISYLKKKGLIRSKLVSIVTDFDVHSMWMASGVDCYTAASLYTKEKLIHLGVAPEKVFTTGIPTHAKFSAPVDKRELCNKLGIKENLFTVLIATGSFGIGPIEELVGGLSTFQLLVVCGNNKTLFKELSVRQNELLKVYGLVDNMDELMSVVDVMITKPGGLSISEAMVKNLPLIFFSAIPGQETSNIKVLKSYGIGAWTPSVAEIIKEVENLNTSAKTLQNAKENTRRLAKPAACRDIASLIG